MLSRKMGDPREGGVGWGGGGVRIAGVVAKGKGLKRSCVRRPLSRGLSVLAGEVCLRNADSQEVCVRREMTYRITVFPMVGGENFFFFVLFKK